MTKILHIKPTTPYTAQIYAKHSHYNTDDTGLDLYTPSTIDISPGETKFIDLEIQCEMFESDDGDDSDMECKNLPYYIYPRSSISKTPLILANHVGIIDAGYRGNLKIAVKYVPTLEDMWVLLNSDKSSLEKYKKDLPIYTIEAGTRLVQLCSNDLRPFNIKLVEKLTDSDRGSGGFGSTGK